MRYSEIITEQQLQEKISLGATGRRMRASIIKNLTQILNDRYQKHLTSMPFHVLATDPNAQVKPANQSMALTRTAAWIREYLEQTLGDQMRGILQNKHGYSDVRFGNIAPALGQWSKPNILIDSRLISKMTQQVYDRFYMSFEDAGYKLVPMSAEQLRIVPMINEIVSVYLHELTHAEQWGRAGRDDIYRSYMTRTKQEFYDIMRSSLDELWKEKVYLASPEEIGAFAQNTAYELYQSILSDHPEYQIEFITGLMQNLTATVGQYHRMRKDTDPKAKKIVNRFLKKVYQELDDARDEILRKHLSEIKDAKEEAEYMAWIDTLDTSAPDYEDTLVAGPPGWS